MAATAIAACFANPAAANDIYNIRGAELGRGTGLFVDFGGRFQSFSMPKHENGAAYFAQGGVNFIPASTLDTRVKLFGPEAGLTFFLPGTMAPTWLGMNPRIGVFGYWTTGERTVNGSQFFPDATNLYRFANLQGTSFNVGDYGGDTNLVNTMRIYMTDWRLGLRGSTDFMVAPNWIVTPGLAFFGGQNRTRVRHSSHEIVADEAYATETRLRSSQIGGQARGTVTYQAMSWLQLHAGGSVGAAHKRARLRAINCSDNNGGGPACDGSDDLSTLSASRSRLALLAGADIGVSLVDPGQWIVVSVNAGFDFDNAVAGYRGQVPGAAVGLTGAPAGIRFSSEVHYNVQFKVSVRLP